MAPYEPRTEPKTTSRRIALIAAARCDLAVRVSKASGGGQLDPPSPAVLKSLLWALWDFSGADGRIYPSYETLAERACCSRSTAIRAMRYFVAVGVMRKTIRSNVAGHSKRRLTTNLYEFDDRVLRAMAELTEVDVIAEENRTSVNLTPVQEEANECQPDTRNECQPDTCSEATGVSLTPERVSACYQSGCQPDTQTTEQGNTQGEQEGGGALASPVVCSPNRAVAVNTARALDLLSTWKTPLGIPIDRRAIPRLIEFARDDDDDPLPRIVEVLDHAADRAKGVGWIVAAITKGWNFEGSGR